jgi:hypothetical protein
MIGKHIVSLAVLSLSVSSLLAMPNLAFAGQWDDVGIPGSYSVPVPPELAPFSSYPVSRVCYVESQGKTYVGYNLPAELTGSQTSAIILSGESTTAETFSLHGPDETANCQRDRAQAKVSCRVAYGHLSFDMAERAKILSEKFPDLKELDGRSKVSALFSTEPIGIIEFADMPAVR